MSAAVDLDEIKEVNAKCILMANLQQASTSGTQTDKAPVYDLDRSAEIHDYENCYNNNKIFNMFTQEEQYTELLEPSPEPHQVQQNDNVIFKVFSVEQDGGTIEQHPATVEETRAYFESLYNNLAIKVEKVNTVNPQQKQQSLYNGKVLLEKHDPPAVYHSEETLQLAQESRALELEIQRLLRAVVSQDIMSIMQSNPVVDTSNLQTELEHTLDHLFQKLENENVELEFQIKNYAKENAHLKFAYKNLFDSINVSQAQTKGITDSLQNKLNDMIYENMKLRSQLSDKVYEQKDTTKGTSVNTQFCKQSILGKPPSFSGPKLYYVTPFPKSKGLPKIDESHDLSKPVTSNSVPRPQE
ncbi:hypothetical protein Tco_1467323 [Tanacetum coccineum]